MPEPILTVTQVARRLGVSTRTIRVYEEEGFISLERSGGRCLVPVDQVEEIIVIQRLKQDLGINHSGVGVILEMRRRLYDLQKQVDELERSFQRRLEVAIKEQKRAFQRPLTHIEPRDVMKVGSEDDD